MATQVVPSELDLDDNSDGEYEDETAQSVAPLRVQQQDPAQMVFEQIVQDAEHDKLNLADFTFRQGFRKKYSQYFNARVQPENQTLFHFVVGKIGHRYLTRLLVRDCPHQLEMVDDSGMTPLYTAIVRNNPTAFTAILEKPKNQNTKHRNPDDLLRVACEHGRNSIHAAIIKKIEAKFVLELISKASEETLCMQDYDGLTPLHLAVQYSQCSESQMGIVRELISRGDKALDKFSKNPPNLSVYEYHKHTREEAQKQRLRTNYGGKIGHETADNRTLSSGTDLAKKVQELGQPLDNHSTNIHSLDKSQSFVFDVPVSNGVKAGSPEEQRNDVHNQGVSPASVTVVEQNHNEAASRHHPERDAPKEEWAGKILQEIKLQYLRSTFRSTRHPAPRDQSQALRFIYGANIEDRNLCFDYSKVTKPVLPNSFRQSFAHMNFDNVLRYVAFNKIEVHIPASKSTQQQAKKSVQQLGRGRTDLTFFFQWLREKNVDHILKVVVDDWPERPHSDKAIEDCLKQFEVERLEWRKLDICSETLLNSCRAVSHLNLWWSGNRAILRSWSEPEGLAKLEKLETITLLWDSAQVLDSAEQIQLYIAEFRRRLGRAVRNFELAKKDGNVGPHIRRLERINTGDDKNEFTGLRTIMIEEIQENNPRKDDGASRGKPLRLINQRNLSAHRWLNCMDTFADEIQNVKTPLTKHDELRRDITVALVDDGVNVDMPTIAGKVIGGATFDHWDPYENGPSPYFVSTSGHGTVMADMICRVCPTAKLSVYKLETHSSESSMNGSQTHNQIVTKSAALAVKAAVARGVDIISISWTVKKPRDTEPDAELKKLGDAIKLALDKGILIFCAAGDAGNFSDEEYPYDFDRNRIIRIGAATEDGRPWDRSGDPHKLDFVFPGYSIASRNARSDDDFPAEFQENTGSSVATALAAGLAALVLHCVRLAAILKENDTQTGSSDAEGLVKASQLKDLKDYRNMKAVFEKIGVDREKYKFIEVWKCFEVPAEIMKSREIGKVPKVLMELAVKFVSSKSN
ncbi:hypothetical protein F4679DRAFT_595566 [Xylaria curta]|nr:hypothetical protein F4679DRAFT_595566 [Xylaria curta]